jgi:hypothetical protein
MRRRHRHDSLTRYEPPLHPLRLLRPLGALLIESSVVGLSGWWLLRTFPLGGAIRSVGAVLALEAGAGQSVTVAIDGGEPTGAEDGLRLYAGDVLTTGSGSHAALQFFDGTALRLQEATELLIEESRQGESRSSLRVLISHGATWLRVPVSGDTSGDVDRVIVTTGYQATLPDGTEAYAGPDAFTVYDGDGPGSSVLLAGNKEAILVGEGQTLDIAAATAGDPYAARHPIEGQLPVFVSESRDQSPVAGVQEPPEGQAPTGDSELLTITEPPAQGIVSGGTVTVAGTVGVGVEQVQINGYDAPINQSDRSFELEITLPDDEEIVITAVAFGVDGTRLAEQRRTVVRNLAPVPPPSFVSPAATGQTYRTQETRFEITGEAPPDTAGIIINDYRLQFYEAGDTRWRYLADTTLENLQPGRNVFRAIAIREGGGRSEPVELTILLEEGTTGVISDGTPSGSGSEVVSSADSSEPDIVSQDGLPQNEPLQPGTLRIVGPAEGTSFTSGEAENIIEGVPPPGAQSLWVNDYRLRLFSPDRATWTYIASTELGTLAAGLNRYEIIARDADYQIVDRLIYEITYEPAN